MTVYLCVWECPDGHVFASQETRPDGGRFVTCNKCGDGCSVEEAVELDERRDVDDLEQLLARAKTLGVL